jgi:hypothetical protein
VTCTCLRYPTAAKKSGDDNYPDTHTFPGLDTEPHSHTLSEQPTLMSNWSIDA